MEFEAKITMQVYVCYANHWIVHSPVLTDQNTTIITTCKCTISPQSLENIYIHQMPFSFPKGGVWAWYHDIWWHMLCLLQCWWVSMKLQRNLRIHLSIFTCTILLKNSFCFCHLLIQIYTITNLSMNISDRSYLLKLPFLLPLSPPAPVWIPVSCQTTCILVRNQPAQ